MTSRYDPGRHHRRSIRLKGYDYTRASAYFVTVCVQNRFCLLGDVFAGAIRVNDAGRMVQTVWEECPDHYAGVVVDAFVVMPNHIHGIIVLRPPPIPASHDAHDAHVGAGPRTCPNPAPAPQPRDTPPQPRDTADGGRGDHVNGGRGDHVNGGQHGDADGGQPRGVAPTGSSLPDVVQRFKSLTTKRYIDGVRQHGWPPFPGRLWQRNYYERIIRDDAALHRVRAYIETNPQRWPTDAENPRPRGGRV